MMQQQDSVGRKMELHDRILQKVVDGSLFRYIDGKINRNVQEIASA